MSGKTILGGLIAGVAVMMMFSILPINATEGNSSLTCDQRGNKWLHCTASDPDGIQVLTVSEGETQELEIEKNCVKKIHFKIALLHVLDHIHTVEIKDCQSRSAIDDWEISKLGVPTMP